MEKKVLVIDDSALMRRVISDIINLNNDYEVADVAKDGIEGYEKIAANPNFYDAIIMDINMPRMDGIGLLKKLHEEHIEQTVIVVSTVAKEGARETIQALEYGAFDFVTKPERFLETKSRDFSDRVCRVLDAATAKMRRRGNAAAVKHTDAGNHKENVNIVKVTDTSGLRDFKRGKKKLVALACSTGGPKSLQQVIPYLPADLDAGVVLVQHMPKGFTKSLAQRLDELSKVTVKEAEEGDIVQKGWVYIAPGGMHMKVVPKGTEYAIHLTDEAPIDGLRPCANLMYDSLKNCSYDEITCVVLTGMGSDGTKGIKALKEARKPIYVIGQDESTSVVYGMPRALAQAGLVDSVVPLNKVADAITKNVGVL